MLDELTAGSLVAEVLMEDDGTCRILVIEGELEERVFKRLGNEQCRRVMGRGKTRILSSLEELLLNSRVVVLLDRDFHDFGEHRPNSPRVVLTDHYNLEFSVLKCNRVGKLLCKWQIFL